MEALTVANVAESDEAFWRLLETVPFGMSDFQIQKFVAASFTDSRVQRQVFLELHTRAKALMDAGGAKKRLEIDIFRLKRSIEEKKRRIGAIRLKRAFCWFFVPSGILSRWQYQEWNLEDDIELDREDIRQKEFDLKTQAKMASDCLREVKCFIAAIPAQIVTRDEFESIEKEYWLKRASQDAKLEVIERMVPAKGTLELLANLGLNVGDSVMAAQEHVELERNMLIEERTKLSQAKE